MWTAANRKSYERKGLRYPSDLTDAEGALIAPMIPPSKRGGRKRSVNVREVINGLLSVLETGCPWRHLPKDFPPKSTVHGYFELGAWDRTLERIHDALCVALREKEGREARPSAAIIDSQSARSAQKGGPRWIRSASTRARKSRGSNATSSPIISGCC